MYTLVSGPVLESYGMRFRKSVCIHLTSTKGQMILTFHVRGILRIDFLFQSLLVCYLLVFVAVLEGMDVVYKVEAVGSGGGATSKKVIIADSGEIVKEAS